MKEDKVIKDLKELNHKLKRQNVLLGSRAWNAERRLEELQVKNKKLLRYVTDVKNNLNSTFRNSECLNDYIQDVLDEILNRIGDE